MVKLLSYAQYMLLAVNESSNVIIVKPLGQTTKA